MKVRKKKCIHCKKMVKEDLLDNNGICEDCIGRMLDMSEFAEVIEVDWGNPLGTNSTKSKQRPKSEEIKKRKKERRYWR